MEQFRQIWEMLGSLKALMVLDLHTSIKKKTNLDQTEQIRFEPIFYLVWVNFFIN